MFSISVNEVAADYSKEQIKLAIVCKGGLTGFYFESKDSMELYENFNKKFLSLGMEIEYFDLRHAIFLAEMCTEVKLIKALKLK